MSGEQDDLVRMLARHVLAHVTPEHCTADCMANAILASDWLAARDRDHEAEVTRRLAEQADDIADWIGDQAETVSDAIALVHACRARTYGAES